MMNYWLIIIVTVLLSFIAEELYKRDNYIVGHIFSLSAVLIVSIFAGIRANSVGTDVAYYVIPYIERVQFYPSFSRYMLAIPIEPLFAILAYVTGKFFSTPFLCLFVLQFLTVGSLYCVFYKKQKDMSIALAMTLYLLLFFNMTLCIVRQCVATSLILFSYFCLEKKGKKRYIVLLIAFLFHYSSVLFMLMCFIFELCKRKKYKTLYKGIILVLTITAFAFIPSILQFLAQMFGGFAGKYYQTFIMKQSASNGISWTETALRGTLLLGPVIAFIKNKENEEYEKNVFFMILAIVLSIGAVLSEYLIRISYFFDYFYLIGIPYSVKYYSANNTSKLSYNAIIVGFAFLYWFIVYNTWNYFGVFPYLIQ